MQVFWGTFFLVLSILIPPATILLGILFRKEKYGIHLTIIGIIQLLFFILAIGCLPSFFQIYIDIVGHLFSDIASGTLSATYIIVIIPLIIGTALSNKPKGFLSHCTNILIWCASGLSVIISPLSLLLYFLYRRMYQHYKKQESPKKPVQSSPTSSSSVPLPIVRQTAPEVRLPSYRICHFMWTRSIIFCEHIQKNPTLLSETYIWTAYFYSITKHIRNQAIVDEIYSQFKPSAKSFITEGRNKSMSLDYIQSAYWQFRNVLNASEIDPRNQDGIAKLWAITAQWAFPDVSLSENDAKAFALNVQLVTNQALEIYKLKPEKEHYYFDIG